MKERGILMSAPMVRAILAGTKTQTRRAAKLDATPEPQHSWDVINRYRCPYGQPGDRLWVRETWAVGKCADGLKPSMLHAGTWLSDNGGLWYAAGGEPRHPISPKGKTRSSLFMPRWASRITLEITGIRVERLQSISEADAVAEGIARVGEGWERFHVDPDAPPGQWFTRNPVLAYQGVWEQINGPGSWDANPWVWVVEFRKVDR